MNCEIVMRWECGYWDEMWNVLRNENGDLKCVCEWKGWLLGIVGLCDRESWVGRIATRKCEMARLSRADSLVGGHLYWEMKWYENRKEMLWEKKWNVRKCEVESSKFELMNLLWFWFGWWFVRLIWLWIAWIVNHFDWFWIGIQIRWFVLIVC